MEQYNQIPRHNMTPASSPASLGHIEFENGSSKFMHSDNSHLYTLVHRLMETVDRQARQISRLESTISEVRSTMRNRSE